MKMISKIKETTLFNFLFYSLIMNPFLNLIFYFGLSPDRRRMFVIVFSIVYFLVDFAIVFFLLIYNKSFRKKSASSFIIFVLIVISYIPILGVKMNIFLSFIIYVFPIVVFSVFNLTYFNGVVSKINIAPLLYIISPISIYYFVRFFMNVNNTTIIDLGNITYLVIGNFFLLILVLQYTIYNINKHLFTNVSYKYYYIFMMFIFTFNLINSGAKGPIISLFIFLIIDFILTLIHDSKVNLLLFKTIIVTLIISYLFAFANSGLSRLLAFNNEVQYIINVPEISETGNVNIVNNSNEQENIDNPEIMESTSSLENLMYLNYLETGLIDELYSKGNYLKTLNNLYVYDVKYESVITNIKVSSITARKIIFNLAFKEIMSKPIEGMGIFGFQQKYGIYPHNFILEMFTDFGLFFGTLVIFVLLISFIKLLLLKNKSDYERILLNLVIITIPYLMVSDSFYINNVFALFLFYIVYKIGKSLKNPLHFKIIKH